MLFRTYEWPDFNGLDVRRVLDPGDGLETSVSAVVYEGVESVSRLGADGSVAG